MAVHGGVDARDKTTTTPPPDGEIGFIEGKIDKIRILDGKGKKSEAERLSVSSLSAALKSGKREKKKSSDLQALEKFDVIVSGVEKKDIMVEPPRTFQLTEDE